MHINGQCINLINDDGSRMSVILSKSQSIIF